MAHKAGLTRRRDGEGVPSCPFEAVQCRSVPSTATQRHPDPVSPRPGRSGRPAPGRPLPRLPRMGRHSSGQARVTLGGKVHYLGRCGSPEAHARYGELVKQYLHNGRQPLERAATVAQAPCSVADLFQGFRGWIDATGKYLKAGKPTSSRIFFESIMRSFEDFAGRVRVDRLGEALLVQWRDRLEQEPRLTRKGINRKVAALLAVLRWGRARGHVGRETWADCSAIVALQRGQCGSRPEHGRLRRAPTFAKIERVAAACSSRHVAAMLRLQALPGCRPGEAVAMKWGRIDRNGPVIDGTPTWVYTVEESKVAHHGLSVRYALPPAAQAILVDFPALPTAYIFSPGDSMTERRQRLRSARATPATRQMHERDRKARHDYAERWDVSAYRNAVEAACERAGVERFTPHEVRHAFATWAANVLGVMAASVALNHRNLSTTQRYLHADPAAAFVAAAAVQRRVGG
jgi:integrase